MNQTGTSHPEYQSYLLRLWRESARGAWRASLQSTMTEQVVHFADVETLVAFLIAQTGEPPVEPPPGQPRPAE
jgi:hypothetical protein